MKNQDMEETETGKIVRRKLQKEKTFLEGEIST